ncbi:MAG TPA: hypothetical protein VHA35_13450 [Dongiaceae bacterium]|jgi:hypothetical protein|nr:hypothetical protein [Dongiaceae bacterium]
MTNRRRAGVLALLLVGGCAGSAPPLPPDTTGTTSRHRVTAADFSAADAALSCSQIAAERDMLQATIRKANADVAANRESNQAATMVGAFVPLAYIGTEGNYADKDAIKAAYARQDVLDRLAVFKHCRSG